MNRKHRRRLERIPEDLSAVLELVNAKWILIEYKPGGPGWTADIGIKGRTFRLNSEYRYIAVEEICDGRFRAILPPEDFRKTISSAQVAKLINDEIA